MLIKLTIFRINATAEVRIRITFSNRNGSKLKQVIAAKNTTTIGAEIGGNMHTNDFETVSMEFLAKIPKGWLSFIHFCVGVVLFESEIKIIFYKNLFLKKNYIKIIYKIISLQRNQFFQHFIQFICENNWTDEV